MARKIIVVLILFSLFVSLTTPNYLEVLPIVYRYESHNENAGCPEVRYQFRREENVRKC